MRIYISVDLEGINGIVHSSQTQPGEPGYERAVQLMHDELNAVIDGCREGGATDICVNDAHWDMRNLRPEHMREGVTLLSGWQKPYSMVSGVGGQAGQSALIDGKFDCAMFVGYHARAGHAYGVLSHTYRATIFYEVRLNGQPAGETALNAALAGHFGIPVAMVTGDDTLCQEAHELLGAVPAVTVKKAVSRYSAAHLPRAQVLSELKRTASAAAADKSGWKLYQCPSPCRLSITFFDPAMADGAELVPMVKRVDARTVELESDDYSVIFRVMLAVGAIGASRKDPHF
jgi:D-amino peptidase